MAYTHRDAPSQTALISPTPRTWEEWGVVAVGGVGVAQSSSYHRATFSPFPPICLTPAGLCPPPPLSSPLLYRRLSRHEATRPRPRCAQSDLLIGCSLAAMADWSAQYRTVPAVALLLAVGLVPAAHGQGYQAGWDIPDADGLVSLQPRDNGSESCMSNRVAGFFFVFFWVCVCVCVCVCVIRSQR